MIILDANILLYAYNTDTPQHGTVAAWLENLLNGADVIGIPWLTIWAFLRIATNPRIWPNPKPASLAFENMRELLAQPGVLLIEPGPRHSEILEKLVHEFNATGPLITDAVLAALTVENGATLASTDRDFSRFTGLRWINPLSPA